MTGRPELDELQTLAESISAEAKGLRAYRRRRTLEHRERRFRAESESPKRQRRRHRMAAAGVLFLLGIGFGTWGIVVHAENKVAKSTPPTPVTSIHGYSLPYVSAGRRAAEGLAAQGRAANIFDCQSWYDMYRLGTVDGQAGPAWHAGFMRACVTTQTNAGGTS